MEVFVNGKRQVVKAGECQPETTLLTFLRERGLTGTKLGCGEGGCGACTVMVSSYDHALERVNHLSVNACLAPLCSVDSCHVTTVEGIGNMRRGLHPVQQRIAEMHGSQCGFCTPGIVMSLYTLLRNNPGADQHTIEESLDGNLCRCTGYRPILDASKSLASDNGRRCCGGGGGAGGGCCMDNNDEKKAQDDGGEVAAAAAAATVFDFAPGEEVEGTAVEVDTHTRISRMTPYTLIGPSEPIFPPALATSRPRELCIVGDSVTWYRPVELQKLLELKREHPEAKVVIGNTEVGIETKFKNLHYPVIIAGTHVDELNAIEETPEGIDVGGSVTINVLRRTLRRVSAQKKQNAAHQARTLDAIAAQLDWFASNQIRNVAALAGNIATASPISDMNPMLMSVGAYLVAASSSSEADGRVVERRIPLREFFVGYRRVALEPQEIILRVHIPFSREFEFVTPHKQARRREDDISIVTGGTRVLLEAASDGDSGAPYWRVADAGFAFGGMAPTTVAAPITENYLKGKPWSAETLQGAYDTLAEDLPLPPNVPGGQCEYRRTLANSFLFKFFVAVSLELAQVGLSSSDGSPLPPPPVIAAAERSAARAFLTSAKTTTSGRQSYTVAEGGIQRARPEPHAPAPAEEQPGRAPVGQNVVHKSARQQVTGEAVYCDDIRTPPETLQAALVLSTRAHARILSVDAGAAAREVDGFEAFFSAADVTGDNAIGAVVKDEECFATEEVHHVGQVIGIVVATSLAAAERAAKLVAVEYEDLPVIMSIEDAIAADSFFDDNHTIETKAADGRSASEIIAEGGDDCGTVIVEGEIKMGGQEHFYLETNATLAVPGENGEMEVFASTQNPTKTQNFCSHVLGVQASKVVCRMKRMGGGFGGKETRSVFVSCAVALAAHLTGRPVKIMLDRDVDMSITGQRHAFLGRYRAAMDRATRKLQALDIDIYNNAGFSLDLSGAVMDRALFHVDNSYRWAALRCTGHICKTNQPSHTAFRGFGGPQGMFLGETALDHLAREAGVDPTAVREANLYTEGDRTHFGEVLDRFHVPALWERIHAEYDIAARREACSAFNRENRWTKRGLAVIPTKFGINFTAKFMNQGGALVHVYTDGTVLVSHGGTEMGQGLHTKVAQVAAHAFGIGTEDVAVTETATDKVANSSPTAASMSCDLYGMATLDACEQIRERLRPIAEKMPGAEFRSVVQAAFFERVNLSAQGFYAVADERCGYDWAMEGVHCNSERGMPFNYFTQGVAACEVEVDVLTGDLHQRRVDIVMDVGKSINPALDIGQIEGAYVQGFGLFTMEELSWGDADHSWVRPTGALFTRGPGTYKIPSFNDVPKEFCVELFDSQDQPFAVHSSKAIGEPPLFIASAAFFAIKEAVAAARADAGITPGYFKVNSPASSERVRMACGDAIAAKFTGGDAAYQPQGSW